MANTLERLVRKRAYIKGRLTIIQRWIRDCVISESTEYESETMRKALDRHLLDFQHVQDQIDDQDGIRIEDEQRERDEFEDRCITAEAALRGIKARAQAAQQAPPLNVNQQQQVQAPVNITSVKLPEIKLTPFDGEWENWLTFKNLFTELIQNNTRLNDAQRFYYLQSYVSAGSARQFVELPLTAENYAIAWRQLTQHYDNEARIIRKHVKNMFEVKKTQEDSASSLQTLIDGIQRNYHALKALNQPVDQWDTFLTYHIMSKLDVASRKEIETKSPSDTLQTYEELMKLLEERVRVLEIIAPSSRTKAEKTTKAFIATSKSACTICKGDHSVFKCKQLADLPVNQRWPLVRKLNLCLNCLGASHRVADCRSGGCRTCQKRHHTLLHLQYNHAEAQSQQATDKPETSTANESKEGIKTNSLSTTCNLNTYTQTKVKQVLLATAIVYIYDSSGQKHLARALLDGCSQNSFITTRMYQMLRLKGKRINLQVSGLNNAQTRAHVITRTTIKSRTSSYCTTIELLVTEHITQDMPSYKITEALQIPDTIQLADAQFHTPSGIDLLIGADIFWEVLTGEQIQIKPEFPKLHGMVFGYIVGGRLLEQHSHPHTTVSLVCTGNDLNQLVQRFWLQEDCSVGQSASMEERECETHYQQTTVRDATGRYTVSLPLKTDMPTISDTKEIALKRFLQLEQKLNGNPEVRKLYCDFMQEYLDSGHMELVPESEETDSRSMHYYMPHHHVLKPTSDTTKLRVVFNASFKTDPNPSLNEVLKVGPTIQPDLFTLILRFRKHRYVLTADIQRMYRQIRIHKDQRDLQRIWWRFNESERPHIYRLSTVTYGTASAPFLAVRTLQQLAMDETQDLPKAAQVTLNDFYMDDVITGASTIQGLIEVQHQLRLLMERGGFQLHKWASNSAELLNNESNSVAIPRIDQTRTLGLIWRPEDDFLVIDQDKIRMHSIYTKRIVLSEIARLFDPLGLCAPLIFYAKTLMQELWKAKELKWDDQLPETLSIKWITFCKQLNTLKEIQLPRCAIPPNTIALELHGFGDASELGFGCCIYLRATDSLGHCTLTLLCAKSRVAPLRKMTIPRLELSAACLLAELMKKVINAMVLKYEQIIYWTDSTITLCRIKSQSSRYATFVANRIARIQEVSSPEQWRHVPGDKNPADAVSRGLLPEAFGKEISWFQGPTFLHDKNAEWPIQTPWKLSSKEQDEELKGEHQVTTCLVSTNERIIDRFSNYPKALRIVALCRRFATNCKTKQTQRLYGPVSTKELNEALQALVRSAQYENFAKEIRELQEKGEANNKGPLRALSPFIDNKGILRVGGRLQRAELQFDQRHPMLVDANHPLSKLLAQHYHEVNLHASPQLLLYTLRQKFWIINGRNLCKKTVHDCVRCFRAKPTLMAQLWLMGQLPGQRVRPSRAFLTVGIDFCGPFHCKPRVRSKALLKTYICVFVCFTTKATHLEIVNDLTTEGFLAAFRRFVARRGRCVDVYSDNGTNLVGGNRALKELQKLFQGRNHQEIVQRFCANEGINWHTIPPNSPHFGGLWESAVKSAKHHMRRAIGSATLTTEEMGTVIAQIEACMNSRPLSPMSADPSDLEPLTPGHFLIGAPLNSILEPDLQELKLNRLTRWQLMQKTVQDFWRRWSQEYLNELHIRKKWRNTTQNIQPGAMVLLKEDNVPPLKWPLGRIIETFSGHDGLVRVVLVKTPHGTYKRGIAKICILPVQTENDC